MSLHDLPSELLHVIIERVVLAVEVAPQSIDEARQQRHSTSAWTDSMSDLCVLTQKLPLQTTSIGLLLSWKLMSAITQTVLSELQRTKRLTFTLDVLMVGERQLWTTWLCIPTVTKCIDTLDVRIRIADGHSHIVATLPGEDENIFRRSGLWRGNGGPPPFMWAFYYILCAAIRRGPTLDLRKPVTFWSSVLNLHLITIPYDKHVVLRHVNILIDTLEGAKMPPPEITYDDWLEARPSSAGYVSEDTNSAEDLALRATCMRPEWLATFLNEGLSRTIGWADYSALFFQRLGSLSISCANLTCDTGETELNQTVDFGEHFARYREEDQVGRHWGARFDWLPRGDRDARFKDWWRKTLKARLAAGLDVGGAKRWMDDQSVESLLLPLPPEGAESMVAHWNGGHLKGWRMAVLRIRGLVTVRRTSRSNALL